MRLPGRVRARESERWRRCCCVVGVFVLGASVFGLAAGLLGQACWCVWAIGGRSAVGGRSAGVVFGLWAGVLWECGGVEDDPGG